MKETTTTVEKEKVDCSYSEYRIKAIDTAVSYAFNSPLMDSEYLSTEVMAVYEEVQKYLPDTAHSMFAASALYALFNTPSIPDYVCRACSHQQQPQDHAELQIRCYRNR